MTDIEVRDTADEHRYELLVEGEIAGIASYRFDGARLTLTHTEVADAYEGQGLGSRLVAAALDDVRRRGITVVPRCPFVASYLQRHPEYADLIAR